MSIEKITEDKIKEIQERREIIKICQPILEKELSQHGIKLNPICMEGFDENERPFNYVKPENENPKLFLGDEHHVLFTFEIEDGVIYRGANRCCSGRILCAWM